MDLLTTILLTVNETLTASNAIIAVSLLLFNLTRNLNNRVAKTSAVVLACVTVAYVADAFISLGPDNDVHQIAARLQWIGIAFVPAAMYHLSDALLATTGLPSRGRRKRAVRILYLTGAGFLLVAAFADSLVQFVNVNGLVSSQAGSVFALYLVYFIAGNGFAFYNVQRARRRCLTASSGRRMRYLQIAFLTPALGIFPYSVALNPGDEFTVFGLIVINSANVIIILMLFFLSYPLYFFGSDIPDRLVKKQLLDFLLRGPATGLIALAVINFTTQATRILGLPGEAFTPPAVVGAVLLWQWFVALALPYLEIIFIYRDEDDAQITKLQSLSDKVLTQSDLSQLVAATTESICDHLRIDTAFVVYFDKGDPEVLCGVGALDNGFESLLAEQELIRSITSLTAENPAGPHATWSDFALLPLRSNRALSADSALQLNGVLGLRNPGSGFLDGAEEPEDALSMFMDRIQTSLDDMRLQSEIYNLLEGLLPQFQMTRSRAGQLEYRQLRLTAGYVSSFPDRNEIFEQVRAALRHYWGGSGITQSNLVNLQIVQLRMRQEQETAVNALRKTLEDCIAALKPEGDRKMTSPEWTLYNILQLRFLEQKKVRDVARRLSMSEADLYRKQRVAILAVTDRMLQRENEIRVSAQPRR